MSELDCKNSLILYIKPGYCPDCVDNSIELLERDEYLSKNIFIIFEDFTYREMHSKSAILNKLRAMRVLDKNCFPADFEYLTQVLFRIDNKFRAADVFFPINGVPYLTNDYLLAIKTKLLNR